jgi:Domain of unknown function (DUF6438)
MVLRRLFMVVVLVAIALLLAIKSGSGSQAGQTPDLSSLSDADLKSVTVRLERKACYGSCPVYALTIHGDGSVEYLGKAGVKEKGDRQGRIGAPAVRTLMSEFASAKFLSLPDYQLEKCTCRRCTDMATAITEISVGDVTHRVNHDYGCGCAPKALFDLESAIDKAVNAEQWTGDVSKRGPFGTTCWG